MHISAEIGPGESVLLELERDYPTALVRVASLRAEGRQHLLFGWVELFPFDMEAPPGWRAGRKPWTVPGRSGWSCGFSAHATPVAEALRWYAEAAAGRVNIAIGASAPVIAEERPVAPEPAWGRFAASVEAPFAMRWHDGPRIHRLVPMRRPSRPVHELGRIPQARQWLKRHLGFDLFAHEEWLCGLAMLAPDPVCASLEVFPSARSPTGGETLSVSAVPRRTAARTANLATLTLHVAEQRPAGWTSLRSVSLVQDGYASLPAPQPTDRVGWALVCAERGLLRVSEPNPWLNQINVGMTMVGGTAKVEVPSGGRRKPAQHYEVPHRTTEQSFVVGGLVDDRAKSRLIKLRGYRRERENRQAARQHIFSLPPSKRTGQLRDVEARRKEAQDLIVDIVRQARRRLVFVDPFFGPREMRLFALRNPNGAVTPRILTGLPALKSLTGEQPGFQVQQGLQFAQDLKGLATQLGPRAPQVRVMPGQDLPVIHDRYLVVDDDVWHCGPSFNELGERIGLIVCLPNPFDVRVMLARVWRDSRPLSELMPTPAGGA